MKLLKGCFQYKDQGTCGADPWKVIKNQGTEKKQITNE